MVELIHMAKKRKSALIIPGTLFLLGIGLAIYACVHLFFVLPVEPAFLLYLFLCSSILIVDAISYWFEKGYAIILNTLAFLLSFPMVIVIQDYPFFGAIPIIVFGFMVLSFLQSRKKNARRN
jgi:hypothetical protein